MLQISSRKFTIFTLLRYLQLLHHRNVKYISINYAKAGLLKKQFSK